MNYQNFAQNCEQPSLAINYQPSQTPWCCQCWSPGLHTSVFAVAAEVSSALQISSFRPQTGADAEWSTEAITYDTARPGGCPERKVLHLRRKQTRQLRTWEQDPCFRLQGQLLGLWLCGEAAVDGKMHGYGRRFRHCGDSGAPPKESGRRFGEERSSGGTSSGPWNCYLGPRGEIEGEAGDGMVKAAWFEPAFWDTDSLSSIK